eukprot:6171853-Pleurochrysis_carterae.AAC.1
MSAIASTRVWDSVPFLQPRMCRLMRRSHPSTACRSPNGPHFCFQADSASLFVPFHSHGMTPCSLPAALVPSSYDIPQPIEDSKHGISLTTSFVKPESADGISTSGTAEDGISGAWAARISVAASTDSSHSPISPDPKRAAAEKRKSVYLYLGIDNEHAAEATGVDGNANSLFFGGPPSFVSESETVFLHAAGSVADLGNFSLLAEARAVGDNAEHRPVEAHWWATGGEEGRKGERGRRGKGAAHAEGAEAAYLKVSDTVSAVLRKRGGRGGHLPDAAEKGATLLVLQFTGTPPFQ